MKFTGLITGCDTQILHGMTFIIGKLIASRIIRNSVAISSFITPH